MISLGPAGRPRGRLPADRHGPAARGRRRQRARGARGARHGPRPGPARLHRARARRLRAAARALRPRDRRGRGAAPRRGGRGRRLGRGGLEPLDRGAGRDLRRVGARAVAPVVRAVAAPRAGYVRELGAIRVGNAAVHLGAGRRTKDDDVDHAVGIVCRAKRGHASRRARCSPRCTPATEADGRRGRARGARGVRARASRAAGRTRRAASLLEVVG